MGRKVKGFDGECQIEAALSGWMTTLFPLLIGQTQDPGPSLTSVTSLSVSMCGCGGAHHPPSIEVALLWSFYHNKVSGHYDLRTLTFWV